MIDDPPSATPMPAQPLATATNPTAPFPPVDSSPDFVPPSVMDPVSILDFLPVDDAFALEMRAETIEQLAGGDALRRGESEHIEAGRSQTNADLVAGRDRVRVHATLHEHTGHALAEQAAHLHTSVAGALDVHAASEDTVLLAGHMRDIWDGGAAIVAAMTDDTVAGGGIRVTTPLDLWVHGLMRVEERIGTCTADAVLMELGATHYEREYGPGVHATGLAVYAGSLYQSNRSTFRPLMRVSSGVRNLIAGGGDGSRGGGGDGGAGDAPATTPPPPSAAGDSGTETASGTLRAATGTGGAGTRAASDTLCPVTGAGGTAQAGVMPGERSADLTGILQVDDVAALAREANVAGTSGNLTRLRRGEDTAGQLRALQDATRGDEADPESVVRSTSRGPELVDTVPELDDTASGHEASAPNIEADIRSGPKVPGMDAPVSHSTVWPPQLPPGVKYGLPGGVDAPPRPAAPESDFRAVYRRLGELRERYSRRRNRVANARIGAFKPIADFDWAWPKRTDRPLIEELFSLAFVDDATNVVLVGPNGVGKTMLVKNLLHHAVLNGFTARFTTASDMLHELAAQDSDASLARRLRRFTGPQLLAIDEVGYLNYDNRYADLLFEVVTRRYLTSPVLITTNKPFSEWGDVFSSAACVVTLVDRLIHRSEIVQLDGESYRLREAKEQAAKRSKARSRRTAKSRAS